MLREHVLQIFDPVAVNQLAWKTGNMQTGREINAIIRKLRQSLEERGMSGVYENIIKDIETNTDRIFRFE